MGLVELFCGIGGVAEAARQLDSSSLREGSKTLRAVDIDRDCGRVYRHNFELEVQCKTIESIDFDKLAEGGTDSDLWWMSPPCQPYCRRGKRDCDNDQRCQALLAMINWLRSIPGQIPDRIVLENVPEFATSSHGHQFREALAAAGYHATESVLCPTQFGVPNRRRRYYLMASQVNSVAPIRPSVAAMDFSVADVLGATPEPLSELWLEPRYVAQYAGALDTVDVDDHHAIAACFASGYGKSIIRSGSYLRDGERLRRFSPAEVARLLGFSDDFRFPAEYSMRKQWKMLGNSLSIPVVKAVLAAMLLREQ